MRKRNRLATPFSFAVVADPHCAEEAGSDWPESKHGSHVDRFMRCVREMEKPAPEGKPDFMLVVGDVHLWELEKHFAKISIPLHVIAGNHEAGERKKEMRELFSQDFKLNGEPSDYYSFVHKGVRFIGVCNAGRGGDHIGHLCSEDTVPRGQCEWLEGELGKQETHKIVFAHVPSHPQSLDEEMYMSKNDSVYFNELILETQPFAVFFGHRHSATTEYRLGRTQAIMLRSCAWNFGKAPLGFMLVDVTQAGIRTREILTS